MHSTRRKRLRTFAGRYQRYHKHLGIAFTNGPVQYSNSLRDDTGAHLLADLDALLLAVNWTHAAVIPSGYIYQISSPQMLGAYVQIVDVGSLGQGPLNAYAGHLEITVMDNTAGLNAGFVHWLAYGYGASSLQAVANQCQLFASLPSTETPPIFGAAVSVALGIPFVSVGAGACTTGINPEVTSSLWWSCGSGEDEFRQADFRTAWAPLINFSYSRNGVTQTGSSSRSQASGMLCVFPLTPVNVSPVSVVKYGFGTPLSIDPFVGWNYAIFGQMWDAFLSTAFGSADSEFSTAEPNSGGGTSIANWITWAFEDDGSNVAGTFFGTLCLLTSPAESTGGGFAYAY